MSISRSGCCIACSSGSDSSTHTVRFTSELCLPHLYCTIPNPALGDVLLPPHYDSPCACVCPQAAWSARSGPSSAALPMRPFPAQPHRPGTSARAASHAAASTSSSGNLTGGGRPAGSANASGSGSSKLGKPPHPQAPPRKRPRVQRDPPTVHDVTGVPSRSQRESDSQVFSCQCGVNAHPTMLESPGVMGRWAGGLRYWHRQLVLQCW